MTKTNTPQLRFPDFTDEWQEKKLDEIAKIERGRFSPRPRNDPKYYGGDIPFVQTSDVVQSNGYISKYTQTLNDKGLKVSKLFPKGTILITIAANIGYSGILIEDMACPDSLIGISCIKETQNHFLNYILYKEQKKMDRIASEAAQKNINIAFLKPYKINIPSLPEQQKIAGFLGKVDERIEGLERNYGLFSEYKKSIMQKIFSQQIRFKDENGKSYPDWEEKKLGETCKIKTGKLDANAMVENGKYRFYTCAKEYFHIDNYAFDTEALLISGNGANVGYIHYYKGKFNAYQRTYVLDKFSQNIIFIKYFLDKYLTGRINLEKKEGNTPYIVLGTLSNMKINMPNKEEQEKIADFLTSLDNKIDQINNKLTQAKLFKKSLLQKMFI